MRRTAAIGPKAVKRKVAKRPFAAVDVLANRRAATDVASKKSRIGASVTLAVSNALGLCLLERTQIAFRHTNGRQRELGDIWVREPAMWIHLH